MPHRDKQGTRPMTTAWRSITTTALAFVLGLAACSAPDQTAAGDPIGAAVAASMEDKDENVRSQPNPFEGAWQACGGSTAPEECSRYVLVQRGDRICGTWAYVATGDRYEGRVVAQVTAPTEARRTHVCGRAGSEATIECDEGWGRVDKPLRLCDGKLGDLDTVVGECFADYERAAAPDAPAVLMREPWVQACLAGELPEVAQ